MRTLALVVAVMGLSAQAEDGPLIIQQCSNPLVWNPVYGRCVMPDPARPAPLPGTVCEITIVYPADKPQEPLFIVKPERECRASREIAISKALNMMLLEP